MGDDKKCGGGGRCTLKDSFPEVAELLSDKKDCAQEVKSKSMNRKNLKEETGCIKTFELCQVLQDPGSPEDVTIIKESFSKEIRDSTRCPDDGNKSNRLIYCKEIIKPYIEAEDEDNICEDELVCDALEAAAADFPSFNFCGQIQEASPDKEPPPVEKKDNEKENVDSKCVQPCYKKVKVDKDSVVAVSEQKKLFFSDKSKTCKTSTSSNDTKGTKKETKKDTIKDTIKDTKKDTNCKETTKETSPAKPLSRGNDEELCKCLEKHNKTVTTLKLVAQDMLCKAYTTVKTYCNSSDEESGNARMPTCESGDLKTKKISFDNLKTDNNFEITNLENQEILHNRQTNPNIVDKALNLTKNTVKSMNSFHSILISDNLDLYISDKNSKIPLPVAENITNQLDDVNQNISNIRVELIKNDIKERESDSCDDEHLDSAFNALYEKRDLKASEETSLHQLSKKISVRGNFIKNEIDPQKSTHDPNAPKINENISSKSDKNPCENTIESNVTIQSNLQKDKSLKFNPDKLKFSELIVYKSPTDDEKQSSKRGFGSEKQVTSVKDDTICKSDSHSEGEVYSVQQGRTPLVSSKLHIPCDTAEPHGKSILDSAGKIADSAYKASANVADAFAEQKTYYVEKIKEQIEILGTSLVEKKDSVTGHIGELKGILLRIGHEKKKDTFIDTFKECKNTNLTDSIMGPLNTAKSSAKAIASSGIDLFDKVRSSTTSLISSLKLKNVPSTQKVCDERIVCAQEEVEEVIPPTDGIAQQLMTTLSTTATRLTKTLEDLKDENPYDVPQPKPADISTNLDDEDDDDLNLGVFDTLKSKLYSMFYENGLSNVGSDSSGIRSMSTTPSRIKPTSSFIDKKP